MARIKNKPTEEELIQRLAENMEINFGGNKQNALIRDNWQCQKCGMNQQQHIVLYGDSLIVHHIDGRGSNLPRPERNQELSNLITLCHPCHGKIHGEALKNKILFKKQKNEK